MIAQQIKDGAALFHGDLRRTGVVVARRQQSTPHLDLANEDSSSLSLHVKGYKPHFAY